MGRPRAGSALVLLAALIAAAGCTSRPQPVAHESAAASTAKSFLDDFVTSRGAVVRRDQGGDVVSEGQGYAMLLAYALDEPSRFAKVWSWTRHHLQRPDGLFAYHWQRGTVVDSNPAADADVQIAWALALAGESWSLPADTAAARRIAEAVAAAEIGYDSQGHPTLAAGPWAIERGQPVQVEPGYWTFPADTALAKLTGDHRWRDLAAADAAHLRAITGNGGQLPPDWATIGGSDGPTPTSAPQTESPPASGQDGLRALVWAACLPATHDLSARWWQTLRPTARIGPLTRDLDGSPTTPGPSPLSLVAAAAVAKASGAAAATAYLLKRAARTAATTPTYYGDAWAALGAILLTTNAIPGCSLSP